MTALYEKYRPKAWSEVVGQEAAIKPLLALKARSGFGGEMFFITGQSGQGKTTLAKLIAAEVADDIGIEQVGGPKVTPAWIDAVEKRLYYRPIGGRGWALIVNEVQSFSRCQVDRLNDVLENIPAHAVWIFTTTNTGKDRLFEIDESPAFLSRAKRISLTPRDICDSFAAHLVAVARAEGLLNGHPDNFYLPLAVKLCKELRNNCRACLQSVQMDYFTKGGAE